MLNRPLKPMNFITLKEKVTNYVEIKRHAKIN